MLYKIRTENTCTLIVAVWESNEEKIMNKKITLTATVLAGLMFGAGATTVADNVWQGHQNIVETKNNIDKLAAKINASQSSLSDLKHQLADAQAQYSVLKQQYDGDMASKDAQIQQKIAEGQRAVAQKQAEVDHKQQTINNLNAQLEAAKQDNNNLSQAILDAQSVREYSDQAVKNTGAQ
jgi:chromosome segregation ATPase